MPSISFPCKDCVDGTAFVRRIQVVNGDHIDSEMCLTCTGLGTKHMNEDSPSDPHERKRVLRAYREYQEITDGNLANQTDR